MGMTCWYRLLSAIFSIPVCRYPMCGAHLTTISPSSSNTRRSTPWVLGCCGPMLMVMVRRSVTTCRPLFPPFRRGLHRVVLAEREPLPFLRHEDPPKIGVVLKANTEHIEHFTLMPIR